MLLILFEWREMVISLDRITHADSLPEREPHTMSYFNSLQSGQDTVGNGSRSFVNLPMNH